MTKIRFLFFFFIIFFILIIIKLLYLQVLRPCTKVVDYLKTKKILPERGRIYDRNNEPLVVNQTTYLLYGEPKKIKNKEEVATVLARILAVDRASVEAKIDKRNDWVVIKSGVSEKIKKTILSLGYLGIGFDDESRRYYPEASLAAHLLGFVGKNKEGENIGYFGLEGYYNKDLTGLSGVIKSERDLIDRPIFFGIQEKIEPENGRDLVLTIDKSVQEIIKNKLALGLERYKAREGCIIVADPFTLQILGMVCLPDFDPDKYFLFSEDYFKNPAISNIYEPGSTFKPIIMAAALEEKALTPSDFYNERGPIKIGEYSIKTWNNKYEGKISMTRILEKSSNVGMVYVGEKLGKKKIYQYLKKYGFGELTGIDLQGEIVGLLKSEKEWYPIDYATVTFGQGIGITPIQMLRAFSCLINGGNLLVPFVVSKIKTEEKEIVVNPKIIRRVVSNKTSEIMKKMLVSTIENGEIKWAKPDGYQIGGKTGTAQIPIKGRYDPSKTVASFVGFVPVSQPKLIILVVLREPQTSPWGSETAGPLFFEVVKDLIVYYNIAPEQ